MADHLPEPVPPEPSRIDRAVVALVLLLVLAAFTVKPLWGALDDRMRVYFALKESPATGWLVLHVSTFTADLDERSGGGVDPWGRPWARWVTMTYVAFAATKGAYAMPGPHEFEPFVEAYSSGPDGVMERGGGDDVVPYSPLDWRAVTAREARLLLLVLGGLIAGTYAFARQVPRAGPKTELARVLTLAFVPALVCTAGVITYYDQLLLALAPLLIWKSKLGLGTTLLGSMLLVWSLAIAAVRLQLRRAPTGQT